MALGHTQHDWTCQKCLYSTWRSHSSSPYSVSRKSMTTCGFKCVIYTVHDFIFNHVCMNISTRFSSKKKVGLSNLWFWLLQPKIPQIRKIAYIPITNPQKNCEDFLPLKRLQQKINPATNPLRGNNPKTPPAPLGWSKAFKRGEALEDGSSIHHFYDVGFWEKG